MKRPTALVAFNDIMAIGAMRAAQDLGLAVGREISITGFDDVPLVQYLIPPLTTIRQPIWEVGQKVISMLLSIMQGIESVEQHVLLPPRLIVRNSTGRLL
jgi:DNA-binding LacI/PurR family transcriptional regulator